MEFGGSPVKLTRADGATLEAQFPKLVAQEQPIKDVHDLRGLSHPIAPDAWLEFHFEGDLFEAEDQRNWIDASFKTYSTPQRLPIPVEIQRGTRVQQSVIIILGGRVETEPVEVIKNEPITLTIDLARERPLPKIGFGCSSFGEKFNAKTAERLKSLKPDHLRFELPKRAKTSFRAAFLKADDLAVPLEIALTLPNERALEQIREWNLRETLAGLAPMISKWIIYTAGSKSTTADSLTAAREGLRGLGPIGVGTNADFYQLNQQRPAWESADFVAWSMNPQVHAFDNLSIAETPDSIPSQIESARQYFPGKPLHISPITLKPRFNPVATAADSASRAGELPHDVDPRQSSLFAAAWTLGMLQQLAQSGADSVTFFETVGWRGIIERDRGTPLPEKFKSEPGGVYPIYYVFRWAADLADARVVDCHLSDAKKVAALSLKSKNKVRLILGNLTDQPQTVQVKGIRKAKRIFHSFPIDQHTLKFAMLDPEAVLESWQELDPGYFTAELKPGELVSVDLDLRR